MGPPSAMPSGHQQSQESAPPVEAVQEMKIITTTYSAQYGHTSGGFIEYTAKSGTNSYHGSGYGYFADDSLNAKGFFAVGKTPLSNNNYGFTLGGPLVIPKVIRRPQQDVLLHEHRLHAPAQRRAARLRQHDADRRVQGRRLQLAARVADWRGRARPSDLRRSDLQSGIDAIGQRYPGPRPVCRKHHSRRRSAAKRRGREGCGVDGASR